jgi:hypothetical protein
MTLLGKLGAASSSDKKGGEGKDKMKMILYKNDINDFMKWGAIGFLGMGIYQLGMRVAKRNINPCVELKDRADSLNHDPIVRDSFINIQSYRDLNPWLFRTALQNVDHLLFLENALLTKSVSPTHNDKVISFSYFRMAVIRLNMLQILVKEELGNDHAMAVNIFVQKIYGQIQKHFLNVLHICSEFKPNNLIARAKQEVEAALAQYKKGKRYNSSSDQWNKFKQKTKRPKYSNKKSSRRSDRSDRSRRSHSSKSGST